MARENKIKNRAGVGFVFAICFLRSTGLVWLTYEVDDEDVF